MKCKREERVDGVGAGGGADAGDCDSARGLAVIDKRGRGNVPEAQQRAEGDSKQDAKAPWTQDEKSTLMGRFLVKDAMTTIVLLSVGCP